MSERYQREIEDLLRQMDGRPLREPFSRRMARRTARVRETAGRAARGFLRRQPMEQFMIASVVFLLASLIARPFEALDTVRFWCNILSVLFFIMAIGIAVVQQRRTGPYTAEQRWRGQMLEYRPRQPDVWTRVRLWLKRRR